jgi:hypothetical protein
MKVFPAVKIIIFITVILLAMVPACTLGKTQVLKIEEEIAQTTSIIPRSVEIEKDLVSIAIEIPSGETESGLYLTCVYLFDVAIKNVPNAKQVILKLYTLDVPYATLTAQSDDIKELISEKIDFLTFFARIELSDERSAQDGLRQALSSRDWIVSSVEINSEYVDIKAFMPEARANEEIATHMFEAMHLATIYAPDSQKINLKILLAEEPDLTVSVNMEDVRKFQAGQIDAGTFLAGWITSD